MSPQTLAVILAVDISSGHSTNKRFRKYGESSAGQRSISLPQKTTPIAKLIFQKDRDALDHDWPNLFLHAFPLIALIPQVIRRIRKQKHRVLLVASLWRSQHGFTELLRLLTAAPWPIPMRWDLLSQAKGTIWHKAETIQMDNWHYYASILFFWPTMPHGIKSPLD